jgi:hypothetical protein
LSKSVCFANRRESPYFLLKRRDDLVIHADVFANDVEVKFCLKDTPATPACCKFSWGLVDLDLKQLTLGVLLEA